MSAHQLVDGLHHCSFPVRDLQVSADFYVGLLGLAVLPRPAMGVPGLWLAAGHGQIHLIECATETDDVGTPPSTTNPRGRHTALGVRDVAAVVAVLERAGVDYVRRNATANQLWVRDPDGHVIEFIGID
jgi:catechol 2,3-dioxygenase-like lactoylglutathione lyase family enzyme